MTPGMGREQDMDDQSTPHTTSIEPGPSDPTAPPTKPFPDLPDEPTPLPMPGDPPGQPGDSRNAPPE